MKKLTIFAVVTSVLFLAGCVGLEKKRENHYFGQLSKELSKKYN